MIVAVCLFVCLLVGWLVCLLVGWLVCLLVLFCFVFVSFSFLLFCCSHFRYPKLEKIQLVQLGLLSRFLQGGPPTSYNWVYDSYN